MFRKMFRVQKVDENVHNQSLCDPSHLQHAVYALPTCCMTASLASQSVVVAPWL